jgi:HAD superfamily hydrolase (TIGR01549 family)
MYYDIFLSNVNIYDGFYNFFEKCKSKNIKLVILTNNTFIIQLQIFNKLKLFIFFDNIFTSYEIGFEKPNIKCYNYITNLYNFNLYEIIMIGDSYNTDAIGSINFGIKYYLIYI